MKHVIYPTPLRRFLYLCAALVFFFIVFLIIYDDGWLPNAHGWIYYMSKKGLTETFSSVGGVIFFLTIILIMSPFFLLGSTFLLASTLFSTAKIKNGNIHFYGALRFTDTAIFDLSKINSIVIEESDNRWCSYDDNGTITLGSYFMSKIQIEKFLRVNGYSQIEVRNSIKE